MRAEYIQPLSRDNEDFEAELEGSRLRQEASDREWEKREESREFYDNLNYVLSRIPDPPTAKPEPTTKPEPVATPLGDEEQKDLAIAYCLDLDDLRKAGWARRVNPMNKLHDLKEKYRSLGVDQEHINNEMRRLFFE